MNIWVVTEEQYEQTLTGTGRYTNPPGWYFEHYGDIKGPFATRDEAERELSLTAWEYFVPVESL